MKLYGQIQVGPEGFVPGRVFIRNRSERGTCKDKMVIFVPQLFKGHVALYFVKKTIIHAAEQQGLYISRRPRHATGKGQRKEACATSEDTNSQKLAPTDSHRLGYSTKIVFHFVDPPICCKFGVLKVDSLHFMKRYYHHEITKV
jgi:hypothetical protein